MEATNFRARFRVLALSMGMLGLLCATPASVEPVRAADIPQARAVTAAVHTGWHGQIGRPANMRAAPRRDPALLGELQPTTPVDVLDWVAGDAVETDNPTWAQVAPGAFVYGMLLRPDTLPDPVTRADPPTGGRWIDVDTTHQIANAYEGAQPVHTTFVSTGRPGWETPVGVWSVQRRVERETMDGGTLIGQGPSGFGAQYHVDNVRWTQYFTLDGSAIHENYWRDPLTFGIPGSHGCVGMSPGEADWFWRWAVIGTPVVVQAD